MAEGGRLNSVELAAELTVAWLSNANTRANPEDVPTFLKAMHQAIAELSSGDNADEQTEQQKPEFTPAVSVRKSLASRDHIVSMLDGKKYRTLTRHLRTNGLTPADYRARYNLPASYPMTAPAYSEQRSQMAKERGLGRKSGEKVAAAKPKTTRKSPAAAKAAAKAHLSGESS